jgi:hypothetical protein
MRSRDTLNVYCPSCGVSSPRELSELARPSGQICLICGSRLPKESVCSADTQGEKLNRRSPNQSQSSNLSPQAVEEEPVVRSRVHVRSLHSRSRRY